jgi:hypothetical protein
MRGGSKSWVAFHNTGAPPKFSGGKFQQTPRFRTESRKEERHDDDL